MRLLITGLVSFGFSLSDVRNMYVDELDDFHKGMVYILEKRGEIEKGTYDDMCAEEDLSSVDRVRRNLQQFMRS